MKRERYILEGEWSGYRSSQRRVCHRVVTKNPEIYKNLNSILFTDGTTLDLSIRKCKPRERVNEIHGYDSLINKCITLKVNSVKAIYNKKGGNKC